MIKGWILRNESQILHHTSVGSHKARVSDKDTSSMNRNTVRYFATMGFHLCNPEGLYSHGKRHSKTLFGAHH